MSNFPTLTDLAFFESKREPAWAQKIKNRLPKQSPESFIDHCVDAHAGIRLLSTHIETANMLAFVRGWMRRGEPVEERLLELSQKPQGPHPRKRAALARKWLKKMRAQAPLALHGWRSRGKAESSSARLRDVGAVVAMPDGTFLSVGSEVYWVNDTQVFDRHQRAGLLSRAVAAGGKLERMTREQSEDWRR